MVLPNSLLPLTNRPSRRLRYMRSCLDATTYLFKRFVRWFVRRSRYFRMTKNGISYPSRRYQSTKELTTKYVASHLPRGTCFIALFSIFASIELPSALPCIPIRKRQTGGKREKGKANNWNRTACNLSRFGRYTGAAANAEPVALPRVRRRKRETGDALGITLSTRQKMTKIEKGRDEA